MKLRILILLAIAAVASSVVAGPIGFPLEVSGARNYGLSATYENTRVRIDDRDNSGRVYHMRTSRVLVKAAYGVFDFLDVFGLAGSADLDWVYVNPDIPRSESPHKFTFGGGVTLRPVYALDGRLAMYIVGQGITYKTTATQKWASVSQETTYRWYEGQVGGAMALTFRNLRPYIGVSWSILTGTYDYREVTSSGAVVPTSIIHGETFTFGNQPPKPVFGAEYIAPNGYRLGFEWRGIYKDEIEWNVWLSQVMIR